MINERFIARKKRVRSKIFGIDKKPRLSIFRSNRGLYAQLVDDGTSKTILGMNINKLSLKGNRVEISKKFGLEFAKKAKLKKITEVVFDRSGYKYHGRIKAFADGVREGGLKF